MIGYITYFGAKQIIDFGVNSVRHATALVQMQDTINSRVYVIPSGAKINYDYLGTQPKTPGEMSIPLKFQNDGVTRFSSWKALEGTEDTLYFQVVDPTPFTADVYICQAVLGPVQDITKFSISSRLDIELQLDFDLITFWALI